MKFPFQNSFRKLSLTQQILSLILLMVVFLLLFFLFFLSDSINNTISKQIFDMLAAKQTPVINALDLGKQPSSDLELFNYISADTNITTIVVTPNKVDVVSRSPIAQPKDDEFLATLVEQARDMLNTTGESKDLVETYKSTRYYCRLAKVEHNQHDSVVVSYMDDSYAEATRTTLLDSTVYITVLVFFLLLMILLLWVFSIIRPLNQIKAYITQIKEGKDVDLYINREDEIGEVAQELRTLTTELAKQEKAKEEMIHNISHDLKTPIATIKSYSESIKDGIYPYGDLESSVDVILDNAKRLEDKVHSLLYMNRVEYLVSSDAEGVTTNMKDVVEEVVLNAKVIRPEIELITDVDEVYFDGLFESWRVCVENILQNAFRYAKTYIKIKVREDELIISNDGPKMPEDRIDSLFKPYIMGEGGKFGLGLSIVSKVVQANEYKVKGMNTEDGVAFKIYRENTNKKPNNRFKNANMSLNVSHWSAAKKNYRSSHERKSDGSEAGTETKEGADNQPITSQEEKKAAPDQKQWKGRSKK
ncbi:HAMP domain-containing sensor histidine kinase [Erysipelotrichaceae bacterium 51-3]